MHNFALVVGGDGGTGVVALLAHRCPFRHEPACKACSEAVATFLAEMRA
jgi:hypothetical protein